MTGKTIELYTEAIHRVNVTIAQGKVNKIRPFSVTCDFEKALHAAVMVIYKDCRLNGCLFHFKQATRSYMKKTCKIEDEQVGHAMRKNILDLLTILPRDEITEYGIPYVRSILDDLCKTDKELEKWDTFWKYFVREWMQSPRYVKTWNIHDENQEYLDLYNRTNNGLERYNRKLGEIFPSPHPSIIEFVVKLKEEGERQVQKLNDVRAGKVNAPDHQELTVPLFVPRAYYDFQAAKKASVAASVATAEMEALQIDQESDR